MKQIRNNIFETNSSSTHTLSHVSKTKRIVPNEISYKDFLNDEGTELNIPIKFEDNWRDENALWSFPSKLTCVLRSIPEFYTGDDDECSMNVNDFMDNETVKTIIKSVEDKIGLKINIIIKDDDIYKNELCLEKAIRGSNYEDTEIFNDNYWGENIIKVIDFITDPSVVIFTSEYYDG